MPDEEKNGAQEAKAEESDEATTPKKEDEGAEAQPESVENDAKVESTSAVTKTEPSGKFADLIKEIEGLSVADLAELVKVLEERFGVSASAPMMMAGAVGSVGAAEAAEEKTNYTVILAASGEQKINVIKALREINQNLGLKEAKDIADAPPKEILKDAPKEQAEEAKKKLEAAGATVEMK